jgi:hypothetical protein
MQFVFKPRVVNATLFGECVEERVQAVFRQHHWHLAKVSVGLTPVNGRDGNDEHQCRIDISSIELGRFTVTASDANWPGAFDAALVRASAELRKRMNRVKRSASSAITTLTPDLAPVMLQPAFARVPDCAV